MTAAAVFAQTRTPTPQDIDALGHVNNAVYVHWIQDLAVAHWRSVAGADAAPDSIWVVVRHEIDYRAPSHLGEALVLKTWIPDAPKGARVDRIVEVSGPDDRLRVAARTTWALLDASTRRPLRVTAEIMRPFVSKNAHS